MKAGIKMGERLGIAEVTKDGQYLHIDNPESRDRKALCGIRNKEMLLPSAVMETDRICPHCRKIALKAGLL